MKKPILICMTMATGSLLAGVYGDVPDAKHAWAVHDRNRPNPVKIAAEPGRAPSDAKVLFDGTEESFRKNWTHQNAKRKADWKVVDGAMESVRRAGYIQTRDSFGDCQLHLEWASPKKVSDRDAATRASS